MERIVGTHNFILNPQEGSGQHVILSTTVIDDRGDRFINQELQIQSYCNAVTVTLIGAVFDPASLRKLADQIEALYKKP